MTWLVRRWTLRHTSDDAGFSMIEMVVALLILALVTTSSLIFFINNLRSANGQSQRQQAVALADQQVETVQSLPISKLVTGRTSAELATLYATPVATKLNITGQDDTSSGSNFDPTATASSPQMVSTISPSGAHLLNGIDYREYTFIDTCWLAASTGLCGSTKATGTAQEFRVSVDVHWVSNSQCANGCDYSTSTLIDPTSDPQFNTNISQPTGSYFSVGSNTTPGLTPTVINDNGGTCTINGTNFPGTEIVVKPGTGFKSNMRVWMSANGGTIPAASVYQPSATEVDFCLATSDIPGSYTISVINTDGGHFQLPITEKPSIGSATGWSSSSQNVTLAGTGFESGVVFSATSGATWTGTSSLVIANPTADGVKLLGFTGPKDGASTTITATNNDTAASNGSITITAPKVTARSSSSVLVGTSTNITLTGANFQSGLTAVLTAGSGTATITSVGSASTATLNVSPTSTGTDTVYVYNPDGGTTSTFTYTVTAPAPTVSGASPVTVTAGTPTTVTVTGTGYQVGLIATTTNGTATVTSVSADGKTVTLTVNATSTNTDTITLTNPDGGSISGALAVTSVLTSFTPNPPVHSTATAWVVNGAGFATGATVTITENGTALTKTLLSITSTKITFTATTSTSKASSPFVITVTNPDGTVATRTQTMTPS